MKFLKSIIGLVEKTSFEEKDNPNYSTKANNSKPLLTSINNGMLTIVLNRPEKLNAIDLDMVELLRNELQNAASNSDIRAIIITGAGKGFCSGGDLKFALEANPNQPGDSFLALTTVLHDCISLIRNMPKPVVAAINGVAAGAGLFLALACDMRMMAKSAYLKQSNTSYGLSLPAGGTFTLPRLIGFGRALEVVMLDRIIPAQEAKLLGLVSVLVKEKNLIKETVNVTYELSQRPVNTFGRVKKLMNESFYRNLNEQLTAEQTEIVNSANDLEGREGLEAFTQKRQPKYHSIN